jgi:hypothetical protein
MNGHSYTPASPEALARAFGGGLAEVADVGCPAFYSTFLSTRSSISRLTFLSTPAFLSAVVVLCYFLLFTKVFYLF